MIGQVLQNLLQSPMAGGQQSPDPTEMVNQVIAQFRQHLEKQKQAGKLTAPLALGGESGTKSIQQPAPQTSPYKAAGRMRSATGEGAATYMQQAGEAAAEPWKPQALDIGLMAATIALPIIAAMQPEGRGRRGLRKQQRKSAMFKTLGELAGKGLGARKGSFEAGKEATFEAAKTRAEMSVEEAQAGYERKISGIGAAESKRRWEAERGLAERGMAVKERPKLEKPTFTPGQLYQQGRNVAADTRKQALIEANQIIQSLDLGGQRFTIKSRQDLDSMIFELEQGDVLSVTRGLPPMKAPPRTNAVAPILARLKELRDQYDTGVMGGGQTGKPADMTDAEWQEYLQMKGQ